MARLRGLPFGHLEWEVDMQRDFIVTRVLLVLGVLALVLSIVLRDDRPAVAPGAATAEPSPARPDSPSWEEELLAPDIQSLRLERRLLLDDLSRRYREETADTHRAALRRRMERVIEVSERDVIELRLDNARQSGNEALVAWLERARADLPAQAPAADGVDRP